MAEILDLDELSDVAGLVRLGGREVPVKAATAPVYRAVLAINAAPDKIDVLQLYALAGRCVPSLTTEEVEALSVAQLSAIIATAVGGVAKVERKFPNSEGPAMASPDSPPA